MADNLTLNSGSGGATLSTDEVTRATVTQHVQYVKLMNGTDAAIDVIPGDATNGLLVNLGSNNDVTVTGTVTVDGSGVTQPVSDAGGSLTVDNSSLSVVGGGAEATAMRVTLANDSTGVLSVDDNGSTLSIDDGAGSITVDNAALSVTGGGVEASALRVTLANDSTGVLSVDDNGGSLTVDGTVTANAGSGSFTVAQATASNLNATVVGTGTFAVQATLQASTNTTEVVGDAAHDAAVAGNPVRIAGRALTSDYTSVATGDTADLITTVGGKLIVHPYALPENLVSGASSDITTTTAQSLIAAGGAGIKNYITHLLVQNSHATVSTWVNIQDGVGGSTIYTVYAAAAGGGASVTLPCPIATTANTALGFACATTGANVRVSASGYKGP